jgi:hypothetical protein
MDYLFQLAYTVGTYGYDAVGLVASHGIQFYKYGWVASISFLERENLLLVIFFTASLII